MVFKRALLGTLAIAALSVSACDKGPPPHNLNELGRAAAARYSSGTVIAFGTGSDCIAQPAMTLRFLDHGKGTYTAPSKTCPNPDGGVAALCDLGLEATLGTSPGTGTLKILKVPDTTWGDYTGEVNLVFDTAGGEETYVFEFVAPVCGIE